jgi:hypothetical protein
LSRAEYSWARIQPLESFSAEGQRRALLAPTYHSLTSSGAFPRLPNTFEQVVGSRAAAYPCVPFAMEPHQLDLYVLLTGSGVADWTPLREDIGIPESVAVAEGATCHFAPGQPTAFVRIPWEDTPRLWPQLAVDVNEQSWLIASLNGQHWNQLVVLHATAFCLGTLVRYHPTLWLDLSSQSQGDLALPLLREAIAAIESTVPRVLVRQFATAQSVTL